MSTLKTPLPSQVKSGGLVSYIRGRRVEVVPPKEVGCVVDVLEATRATASALRRTH